jgi:hypothetical protein
MNYKVSKKNASGKFWSYGNIKQNQWGNLTLGFKVTPELKAIFNDAAEGSWINFSLFEDKPKIESAPTQNYAAASGGEFVAEELNDEMPF